MIGSHPNEVGEALALRGFRAHSFGAGTIEGQEHQADLDISADASGGLGSPGWARRYGYPDPGPDGETWIPPIWHSEKAILDELVTALWRDGVFARELGIPVSAGHLEAVAGGSQTIVATHQELWDIVHCMMPGRTNDPLWRRGEDLMTEPAPAPAKGNTVPPPTAPAPAGLPIPVGILETLKLAPTWAVIGPGRAARLAQASRFFAGVTSVNR